jgi:hypothetical protein
MLGNKKILEGLPEFSPNVCQSWKLFVNPGRPSRIFIKYINKFSYTHILHFYRTYFFDDFSALCASPLDFLSFNFCEFLLFTGATFALPCPLLHLLYHRSKTT